MPILPDSEFLMRLPTSWTCVGCKREFPYTPHGEMAYAFRWKTDPQTGRQVVEGDLCRGCAKPVSPMVTVDYSTLEARVLQWGTPTVRPSGSPTGRLKR